MKITVLIWPIRKVPKGEVIYSKHSEREAWLICHEFTTFLFWLQFKPMSHVLLCSLVFSLCSLALHLCSLVWCLPVRKYRALQSQNKAIIGRYCSFLAIIHHCKNVAIFARSCKNVGLVQGLILAPIRPCIRITAAIFFGYQCYANATLILGLTVL